LTSNTPRIIRKGGESQEAFRYFRLKILIFFLKQNETAELTRRACIKLQTSNDTADETILRFLFFYKLRTSRFCQIIGFRLPRDTASLCA
jgi:hypothetical protein